MPLTSTRSFNRFFPVRLMPSRPMFRIKCVNRTGYSAGHQKIRFIGGHNSDGSAWKLSQEKAVDSIGNGTLQLYLVVDRQPLGNQDAIFIRTSIGSGSFRQKPEATSWLVASYAAQGIII